MTLIHFMQKRLSLILALAALTMVVACSTPEPDPEPTEETAAPTEEVVEAPDEIIIGLITKTETNPFFVKMKEGAQAKADELGATLMTAAGTFDGDNESQVTAIENMVAAGAQAILITPSDTSAIVPSIESAREAGVLVIALDTPTDPQDATDALFATDNFLAGQLIGEYAAAEMGDEPAKIALLNLAPGISVGQLRRDGFLDGYGISESDPQVVCQEDTRGDQAMGQTAMENCLTKDPDINVVYTINEPAAFGAYTALEAAGRADDVLIVSVDGGCAGVEGINDGRIAATSQQYPLRMASLGVEAGVNYALSGRGVEGYTDTGVTLITNFPKAGLNSEDGVFGVENCWGEPSDGAMDDAEAAVAAAREMMAEEASAGLPSRGGTDGEIIIGLITKTETNPFFVKMKEGAQAAADAAGATLMTAAGTFDGDNESQVTAIENMVAAGAQGILITPSDTSAIVPAIEAARAEGVMVIALDTPTEPENATDALFATDNFLAGVLIGEYARAIKGDDEVKIALLNLAPGISVGQLRRDGFIQGYGIEDGDPQIVCEEDTRGDQAMGQTAMENCLTKDPEIDVVYTINEPAAFGAYTAIEAAGRADDVLIVSVDGGCAGVEGVNSGLIGATSQQYPLRMASLGVEAVVEFAQTGRRAFGYTDTGVTLITNNPQPGLASENGVFGIESCWGEPSDGAMEAAEEAVANAAAPMADNSDVIIGLITKTETNPFFVKMKEGAQQAADELGITLMTAAGTFDGDNESQVTAIENMIAAGAQGILITPSDTSAIVPAIERAREAGVIVIALDTPTDPEDATNALYATDNFLAGVLIGEYARGVMGDEPVKIALLNLAPGISVGQLRRDGFVQGYGIEDGDPQIVCEEDTRGDQAMGQTAMENCLTRDPEINVVYTINEPAAFGAYTALQAAGRADDVLIVSVDGGCAGVRGIVDGQIAATSQQYPLRMASLGVTTIVDAVNGGEVPSGYTDTGVTLITDNPVDGVESEDTAFGLDACWGE